MGFHIVTNKEYVCDNMKRRIEICMAVLLIMASTMVSIWSVRAVSGEKTGEKIKVLIDAGHGGQDPGKVSRDGTKEKDLNLAIATRLGKYLKEQGVEVYYTRQKDEGLYTPETTNKKVYDMQKRCEIVENVKPDFMISIHQNSFSEEKVHGAQVFYYATSQESQALGEALQQALVTHVDPENHRKAKANESYYILKKTKYPSVIVECGFLSNGEECAKLKTDSYQEKLVEGIYQGILIYLQEKGST